MEKCGAFSMATSSRSKEYRMATAWANFARTGNPSQHGLTWTPFDPDRCPTMVFDDVCRVVDDPEAEARKILIS
jgi:para-nitrobenzyl esterase